MPTVTAESRPIPGRPEPQPGRQLSDLHDRRGRQAR